MTTTLLTTAAIWFHTVATVVLIGHYLLLALAYLPVFSRRFSGKALFDLLAEINGAVRQRIFAALGMFAITGVYLMIVNPAYLGVGRFGNAWSILMLLKHLLVLVMVGLVVMFNNVVKAGATSQQEGTLVPARLHALLRGTSICGLLVILLTALAQAW